MHIYTRGIKKTEIIITINSKMNKEIKKSTRFLVSKEDFANTKTEIIKWLIGLFFALALMIIGLYFK